MARKRRAPDRAFAPPAPAAPSPTLYRALRYVEWNGANGALMRAWPHHVVALTDGEYGALKNDFIPANQGD